MPLGGLGWKGELESDSKRFRKVKDEVQVLGIDDAPFKDWDKEVKIVAALFRGPRILDGVFHTQIEKDGLDATDKVIQLIRDIKRANVRAILLDGITFGGFNIIDIQRLYRETGMPVIVAMQKRPDFAKIKAALRNLDRIGERKTLIEAAGPIHTVEFDGKKVYIQKAGIELEDAEEIIKKLTINGLVPEPLRAAHLIGKGAYQEMETEEEKTVGIHVQVYKYVKEKKQQMERAKHKYLPGAIGEVFTFLFALLLAWLFIQGMGILLNTSSPLVVVESESMQHPPNWKDWHLLNGLEPSTYGFQGGMGVGDIIIVKGDGLKDINVGDVIVYQKLDCNSDSGGEPIIHRVIGTADVSGGSVQTTGAVTYADGLIKTPCDNSGYILQGIKDRYSNAAVFKGYNTENFRLFFTRGDNNRQEDQCNSSCLSYPIHEKLVVGRAKFDIPYLGYVKLGLVCAWNYATGNACSSHCWWPANHPRCRDG